MSSRNINSFAENMNTVINGVNESLEVLNSFAESLSANEDSVQITLHDDSSIIIPSYNNVLNRLKTVENTVESFTSGQGTVKLMDGTHRNISVSTVPISPNKIENLNNITTFDTDSNWFFENLVFPKIIVSVDLKDKIDAASDRIYINRVILDISDKTSSKIYNFYKNNIEGLNLSYTELIQLLTTNNISYYEDIQTLDFPLVYEKYIGKFPITKIEIIDGQLWYYLDNINYGVNNNFDLNIANNYDLQINDLLRFKNSVYKIVEINKTYNRVRIISSLGMDLPSVGAEFIYYNEPFADKKINIPIGYNEINCIFFKGVNENYNLIGNEWSDMVSFVTNDLSYVNDSSVSLSEYYTNFVSDFGAEWIAKAKERQIQAYNGKTPNSVILNKDDFKVVQVNTQVNAALDEAEVKNTYSDITTVKSTISSLRNTIALQKADLTKETNNSARLSIQKQIDSNINALSNATKEYSSLVEHLNTYIADNNAVVTSPKYRIRGFFSIPESQYSFEKYNENNELIEHAGEQQIIGFDIKYRYLKMDETGVALNTFDYTDTSNNKITGVFSDWNYIQSKFKERYYNNETGLYEWKTEVTSDGSEVNINQVDIPITDGEKVEFAVRAISEAGYPGNPLKSDWSNYIIIDFPSNLSTTDQLTNILNSAKSETTAVMLENMLSSVGYYSHISDETVSPVDNTITYHHDSEHISYKRVDNDEQGITTITTTDLYSVIRELTNRIKALEKNQNK